jgi:hypothetical protein
MHLIQLARRKGERRVAIVEEPAIKLLKSPASIYELALNAIERNEPLTSVVTVNGSADTLDYDHVYSGRSEWRLLPAFDHPHDPAHCLVTGTGLTHKAGAANRDKMHKAQAAGQLTDSMRMYLAGVENGRPAVGQIGVQPEWFYKGTGIVLRAHGEPLVQPPFADDGGEEPEVAAIYLVDRTGTPWRIGLAAGNEFSDHVMERKNYLYLAHSKLRECAIGPELAVGAEFQELTGSVKISRGGQSLWSHDLQSGETHMAHSLANLEYHHFKYAEHRVPGQAHIHFLGTAAFSFGAEVKLAHGDVMEVAWPQLGRPLRNTLHIEDSETALAPIKRFTS